MSSKCDQKYIKELDAHKLKVKYLDAKKAYIGDLKAKNVESDVLIANGVNVEQALQSLSVAITTALDVPTCDPESVLGEFTPEYSETYGVRQDVFEAMLLKAYDVLNGENGLKERFAAGRARLGLPLEGIRLAGSMTFAPWVPTFPNDSSHSQYIDFQTKVKWNIKAANTSTYINGYQPNPSIVSIYIQYGYIDKVTGLCKCEMLNLGNLQLDPTIDYKPTNDPSTSESWGEIFGGVQVLDTKLVQLIYANMPEPLKTGGVQLLFFAEDDVQILRLNSCNSETRINSGVTSCGDNCDTSVEGNIIVHVTAASLGEVTFISFER